MSAKSPREWPTKASSVAREVVELAALIADLTRQAQQAYLDCHEGKAIMLLSDVRHHAGRIGTLLERARRGEYE